MSHLQNLVINGSGTSSGGSYLKVKIRGEGTISNDLECFLFKSFGSSESLGNVNAQQFEVFGETTLNGNLTANDVKIHGTVTINGKSDVKRAKVRGTLDSIGPYTGDEANVIGSLSVKGNVELEQLKLSGFLQVDGLLNADSITIGLRYGISRADEIGGGRIIIKKKSKFNPFINARGTLDTQLIEGDEVFLENTRAKMVRGKNVTIGPGCEIEVVEYYHSFSQASNSLVRENKKINSGA